MIFARSENTVLADLASNIFAVCLICLLLLVGASRQEPPAPALAAPLDAIADLDAVRRQPLAASDMIEILRARRPDAPGLSIDLTADMAHLTAAGATRSLRLSDQAAEIGRIIATMAAGGDIRLYVFANDTYPTMKRILRRTGRHWREISIPPALGEAGRNGAWSDGFRALLRQADDAARFRQGLTRLLDGGEGRAGSARETGERAAAGPGPLTRLAALAGQIMQGILLAAGLGVVILVERRRRPVPRLLHPDAKMR